MEDFLHQGFNHRSKLASRKILRASVSPDHFRHLSTVRSWSMRKCWEVCDGKGQTTEKANTFPGWWLGHPSEKYESQLGWLFPWEHKKCSKPPTSFTWHSRTSIVRRKAPTASRECWEQTIGQERLGASTPAWTKSPLIIMATFLQHWRPKPKRKICSSITQPNPSKLYPNSKEWFNNKECFSPFLILSRQGDRLLMCPRALTQRCESCARGCWWSCSGQPTFGCREGVMVSLAPSSFLLLVWQSFWPSFWHSIWGWSQTWCTQCVGGMPRAYPATFRIHRSCGKTGTLWSTLFGRAFVATPLLALLMEGRPIVQRQQHDLSSRGLPTTVPVTIIACLGSG